MRGAIDLTLIAGQLLSLDTERSRVSPGLEKAYEEIVYDAMVVALSGRIFLDETAERSPEEVLREIWEDHYLLGPAAARQPG